MSEVERNLRAKLNREKMIMLTRQSVAEAHEQNPNALGFVIHGSRANEGIKGKTQPRGNSDLDVIIIRNNGDDKAEKGLGDILWDKIGQKYNILIDTGPWGSLEWDDVLHANDSQADKRKFRREWKHLGDAPVVIGADPEIEAAVKKALFE